MRYTATHKTRYTYEQPVSQCLNEARLVPRDDAGQRVLESSLAITPEPSVFESRIDYFGNHVTTFSVFEPHDRLTIVASSVVEVEPRGLLPWIGPGWEEVREMLATQAGPECLEAYEYTCDSPFIEAGQELNDFARPSLVAGRTLAEAARDLMHRIRTEFRYEPKSTEIDTPLAEVMRQRKGVCQDFAHVMIGALRSWGLAARYVSGYLRSGANYQGAEASHAWVAVFVPGAGWLPFDPTNDVIPAEGHVTLAWGRDYGDVTPVKGISLGGGDHTVEVEVRVVPM
jgi:transglutaminase-like putative cysteine protease